MGALGNPANSGLDYADLGSVVVHDDGRVYYIGQPLFDEDNTAIKEACKKLTRVESFKLALMQMVG